MTQSISLDCADRVPYSVVSPWLTLGTTRLFRRPVREGCEVQLPLRVNLLNGQVQLAHQLISNVPHQLMKGSFGGGGVAEKNRDIWFLTSC